MARELLWVEKTVSGVGRVLTYLRKCANAILKVAKRQIGIYAEHGWLKKNPKYTQAEGRQDMFQAFRRSPAADVVQEALDSGALGYVVKAKAGSELLAAVDAVLLGTTFIGSTHTQTTISYPALPS